MRARSSLPAIATHPPAVIADNTCAVGPVTATIRRFGPDQSSMPSKETLT